MEGGNQMQIKESVIDLNQRVSWRTAVLVSLIVMGIIGAMMSGLWVASYQWFHHDAWFVTKIKKGYEPIDLLPGVSYNYFKVYKFWWILPACFVPWWSSLWLRKVCTLAELIIALGLFVMIGICWVTFGVIALYLASGTWVICMVK